MQSGVARSARCLTVLLVVALLGACTAGPKESAPSALAASQMEPAVHREMLVAAPLIELVAELARQAEQPPTEVPELWIATHMDASLWDGPGADAARIGPLPVGSYFRVIGDPVGDRLPVHYFGNTTIRATDGWVNAQAIGPIGPPTPNAAEPNFPPRRILTDVRSEVTRGDPSLPLIALTFDAGADRGASIQLLDVLRDRNVRATFFVTGQFADRYPDIMQRLVVDGHELANHSYSHPDFARLTEAQMRSEIQRATESIERTSGVKIAPLWRPPFGSRNARIIQIVEEEGLRSIYWTFDSGDWIEGATTQRVIDTDLRLAVNGAIVVHHVQPRATAEAMPTIIETLRARGFDLVTVTELLGP
jgi:peptidoglycan/xylan/chitin deacetylase (PgdA/CDA1 family)